jgi:hypothetical protein
MKRLLLLVGLLLPALGSCDNVLDPNDVVGEYVLQGTPVVLHPGHGRLEIRVDTLRLNAGGSATRVSLEAYESEFGSYVNAFVVAYRYSIRNGRVELEFLCPPNALCTPPPHIWGSPTSGGLILRHAIDPGVPLLYERTAR